MSNAVMTPRLASQSNPGGILILPGHLTKQSPPFWLTFTLFSACFVRVGLFDIERLNSVQDFNRATLCRHYSHEDSQDDR